MTDHITDCRGHDPDCPECVRLYDTRSDTPRIDAAVKHAAETNDLDFLELERVGRALERESAERGRSLATAQANYLAAKAEADRNWNGMEAAARREATLRAALIPLVNLSSHPLFIPQNELPAWDEKIEAARAALAGGAP